MDMDKATCLMKFLYYYITASEEWASLCLLSLILFDSFMENFLGFLFMDCGWTDRFSSGIHTLTISYRVLLLVFSRLELRSSFFLSLLLVAGGNVKGAEMLMGWFDLVLGFSNLFFSSWSSWYLAADWHTWLKWWIGRIGWRWKGLGEGLWVYFIGWIDCIVVG